MLELDKETLRSVSDSTSQSKSRIAYVRERLVIEYTLHDYFDNRIAPILAAGQVQESKDMEAGNPGDTAGASSLAHE